MKHSTIEALAFGFVLALTAGCGSPDVNTSDTTASEAEAGEGESGATSMDESGDTTASSTGGGECESTHSPNDSGAADGETCTEDEDCTSNFCLSFADAPVDAAAVCAPVDFGCSTRAAGTVRDFVTRMPIEGLSIKVSGAIAASVNPNNAPVLAEDTTNAMGQFDMTSDERIEQPLGIVGIVSGDGFHLSATGLQSPSDANFFPPGTGIHDVWTLSLTTLGEWNTALESDTDLADFLPLGDKGGVVGMVRDGTTGEPAPGHTVVTSGDRKSVV